jgi:hypothetical protein
MRLREKLIQDRGRYVQRMQKAMVEMNLMLVNVVDDVTGKTGMAIIEAILAGERDPKVLASKRDGHCKHSQLEIEEAMKGIYKEDQLVALSINHAVWKDLQKQIDRLDVEMGKLLRHSPAHLRWKRHLLRQKSSQMQTRNRMTRRRGRRAPARTTSRQA